MAHSLAHATMLGAVVLYSATVSLGAAAVAPQWLSDGLVAECWETRCQRDSWFVKGCDQYGMTETQRVPCASGSGHVYTCCRPTNETEPHREQRSLCDHGTAKCRPTKKGVGSRAFDGCWTYEGPGVQSLCTDGYQYVCCMGKVDHDDDDDSDDDDDDDDDSDDDDDDDDDSDDDDDDSDDDADDNDSDFDGTKTGRMTYFHLALTACGKTYSDDDMVGAVGPCYFSTSNPNNDPVCGKKVKIVDPSTSKSVVVRIVDKCGGCKKNDINVSPAAFKKLKPLTHSVAKVKWAFIS